MNVCIIGDGLTSLSLAKNLINKKINVHIYQNKKNKNSFSNRTIGISKNNLEFFEKEIYKLPKKIFWQIKKIEIYSEKSIKSKILNFENDKSNLFNMVRNDELYKFLNKKLLNNKYFKKIIIKEKSFYKKLLKDNNYDLIINCNQDNPLSKKHFVKTIDKDYKNLAYTTFLEHEKLENNTATQVFTRMGPIAFLPISNTKTSVVFSINTKDKKYEEADILNLIIKNNKKLKIKKILNLSKFKLKSSILRNYYYKNILAFGDLLHRIHPLAGQGFNMTIRDIKVFSAIIQKKIDLGIQLDTSILEEFEKKTKNKNFIFSSGIDFIYELFNFDRQFKNKNLNKILEFLGNKKNFTNSIIKFADRGFSF